MARRADTDWDTASNKQAESGVKEGQDMSPAETEYLALARRSYQSSTDWLEANVRRQWERNLRSFNNMHPLGSKYHSEEFKHRSKLYRPKSRSAIRKSEAHIAQAFFGTSDLVNITPEDEDNEEQKVGAEAAKYLLNARLDKKPIRWFPTVVGAFQDTRVIGVCCSKQYWHYEERVLKTETRPRIDPETGLPAIGPDGAPVEETVQEVEVLFDEPKIRLVAPENIRIDPGADWLDPINSSPYVIELIPMYVVDIKARMETADPKTGDPQWKKLTDAQIKSAMKQRYSSTRQAREKDRQDAQEASNIVSDHNICWVHENVIRRGGEDIHFFTLGTDFLLTEPQKLGAYYLHKQRPWAMGYSNIEAHRTFPAAILELTQDLQQEANEVANQRIDNVRFAMNPRTFYRIGAGVDLAALRRSRPGSPVGMKNPTGPNADVMVDRPNDVTSSAYQEQDRINVDFDEMAGSFSTSSVQTNRQLNETVGGMRMLKGGAAEINDYDLRIFAETWVEVVLTQLVQLEQFYETDEVLLAVAGKKSKAFEKFGQDADLDKLLRGHFKVRVNVGIGATDPKQRLDRFMVGAMALKELLGDALAADIDKREVAKEVFGILGYRDGDRFFMWGDGDPKVEQLQKTVDMLKKALEDKTMDGKVKMAQEHLRSTTALSKQSMADQTKLLTEILRQDAQAEARREQDQSAINAKAFDAVVRGQEDSLARRFQSQESDAERRHKSDMQHAEGAMALRAQSLRAQQEKQSINGSGGTQ